MFFKPTYLLIATPSGSNFQLEGLFVFQKPNLFLLVLGLVIACYIICFILIKKVSKIDTNFDKSKVINRSINVIDNTNHINNVQGSNGDKTIRYCTNCGAPISDNYCAYCGNKKV